MTARDHRRLSFPGRGHIFFIIDGNFRCRGAVGAALRAAMSGFQQQDRTKARSAPWTVLPDQTRALRIVCIH
jgi:hypothetical protein